MCRSGMKYPSPLALDPACWAADILRSQADCMQAFSALFVDMANLA